MYFLFLTLSSPMSFIGQVHKTFKCVDRLKIKMGPYWSEVFICY